MDGPTGHGKLSGHRIIPLAHGSDTDPPVHDTAAPSGRQAQQGIVGAVRRGTLTAMRCCIALARRIVAAVAVGAVLLAAARPGAVAAADFTRTYVPGTVVYDETGAVAPSAASAVPEILQAATERAGIAPVFYVHRVADAAGADASTDASYLVGAWLPDDPEVRDTLVVVMDVAGEPACPVDIGVRVGSAWSDIVTESAVSDLVTKQLKPALGIGCDPDIILLSAAGGLALAADAATGTSGDAGATPRPGAADAPAVGPPWPAPETGRRVYDYARVFSNETAAATQTAIDRIAQRTGAQVVVYTQVKPGADSASTERDAISLMDTWGVGRKGFDDGLVILWNLDDSLRHGQVQLYAGPGFRNLVSNDQRQAIYENDMLPLLRSGDLDGAMTVAMQRLEELATPENASRLQFFRQLNAVIGLILAPILFFVIAGWSVVTWYRRGRDPVVTQSSSMLMPDPPAEMTPASGSVVLNGGTSRRALTAAMLDLASRGELIFEQEETGRFIKSEKLAIRVTDPDTSDPRIALNRRPATGPAEAYLLSQVQQIADHEGHIAPEKLLKLGEKVGKFDSTVEKSVTDLGWFTAPPGTVRGKWAGLGFAELMLGIAVLIVAFILPSDGMTVAAIAIGAGGVVTMIAAAVMPARTQKGALARVWLDGYSRTLKATMEQARSMDEVVAKSGLTWLETPDRAVVWATALGLQDEIEKVLERSIEDMREGTATPTVWLPLWYHPASGGSGWGSGAGGLAPGLMAGSAVPDFGGMMASLGTIGNSPSSSGSGGGGGGFGGGGSGGGGGGAGGGF